MKKRIRQVFKKWKMMGDPFFYYFCINPIQLYIFLNAKTIDWYIDQFLYWIWFHPKNRSSRPSLWIENPSHSEKWRFWVFRQQRHGNIFWPGRVRFIWNIPKTRIALSPVPSPHRIQKLPFARFFGGVNGWCAEVGHNIMQ